MSYSCRGNTVGHENHTCLVANPPPTAVQVVVEELCHWLGEEEEEEEEGEEEEVEIMATQWSLC